MREERPCECCKAVFLPKCKHQVYCSRKCYNDMWNRNKKDYHKSYSKTYHKKTCPIYIKTCPITGNLFVARDKDVRYSPLGRQLRKQQPKTRKPDLTKLVHCSQCSKEFEYRYRVQSKRHVFYCSDDCRKARTRALKRINEKDSGLKRVYKLKRKKRIQSVQTEKVSRLKVFESYNWHCALCNTYTPQHLIGSNSLNEPTLDHIIPLSKGGSHSYDNLQLLCRYCNSQVKGDKVLTIRQNRRGTVNVKKKVIANRHLADSFSLRFLKFSETA